MNTTRLFILGGAFLVVTCGLLLAGDGRRTRRPLDLPVGGVGYSDEKEAAGDVILFFGNEHEGTRFIWCVDGGLDLVLREEVAQAIESLSIRSSFTLVSFGRELRLWRAKTVRASISNRASAVQFLMHVEGRAGACCLDAIEEGLRIAGEGKPRDPTHLFVVGGGILMCDPSEHDSATDESAVDQLSATVPDSTTVHAVVTSRREVDKRFLRSLAERSGGTYREEISVLEVPVVEVPEEDDCSDGDD